MVFHAAVKANCHMIFVIAQNQPGAGSRRPAALVGKPAVGRGQSWTPARFPIDTELLERIFHPTAMVTGFCRGITDYLHLIDMGDDRQIIGKAFHSEARD